MIKVQQGGAGCFVQQVELGALDAQRDLVRLLLQLTGELINPFVNIPMPVGAQGGPRKHDSTQQGGSDFHGDSPVIRTGFVSARGRSAGITLRGYFRDGRFQFLQFVHLAQVFKYLQGFFFIHPADGETDVYDDIVAYLSFGNVGQVHFFLDAAETYLAGPRQRILYRNTFQPAWYA
jgi:hypothetical protein